MPKGIVMIFDRARERRPVLSSAALLATWLSTLLVHELLSRSRQTIFSIVRTAAVFYGIRRAKACGDPSQNGDHVRPVPPADLMNGPTAIIVFASSPPDLSMF